MVLFAQFVFGVSSLVCGVNTTTEKRGGHRHASVDIVCSADSRRLTRGLNNIHCDHRAVDVVYRVYTVVADVV